MVCRAMCSVRRDPNGGLVLLCHIRSAILLKLSITLYPIGNILSVVIFNEFMSYDKGMSVYLVIEQRINWSFIASFPPSLWVSHVVVVCVYPALGRGVIMD